MSPRLSSLSLAVFLVAACSSSSSTPSTAARNESAKPLVGPGGPGSPSVTIDSLVADPDPVGVGQPTTLTATVTASFIPPSGTITFTYNGAQLGAPAMLTSNPANLATEIASISTTGLPIGADQVFAQYIPSASDMTFGYGPSLPYPATVNVLAATNVALIANEYTVIPGDPLYFTVSLTATGIPSSTFAGSVTVYTGGTGGTAVCTAQVSNGVATCAPGGVADGDYPNVVAVYTPSDSNSVAGTSNTIDVNIEPTDTSVAIVSSDNGSGAFGSRQTFSVTVTSAGASLYTGTVTVSYNGTTLCQSNTPDNPTAPSPVYTCADVPLLPAGFDDITATYSGDANAAITDGTGALLETVAPATPGMTLTSDAPPGTVGPAHDSMVGQTVTLTATLTGVMADSTGPQGTVEFFQTNVDTNATTSIGSSPVAMGAATQDITYATTGNYTYSATFTPSSTPPVNYGTATTALPYNIEVVPAQTSIGLSSSNTPNVTPGTNVTFTATVTTSVTNVTPTGTVNFYNTDTMGNTTLLGAGTLGANGNASNVATYAQSFVVGTYSITAVYQGDTNFNASAASTPAIPEDVAQGTSSVSVVTNPLTTAAAGASVTITATVGPTGATGSVVFTDDLGNTLCSSTSPQPIVAGTATCTTTALAPGARTITATYGGDTQDTGNSGNTTITIGRYATTTTLTNTPSTSAYGKNVVLAATVTHTDGTATLGGTVTFTDSTMSPATTLGTVQTLANGQASISVSTLTVGGHMITATYADASGDANYAASSDTVTQTVVENTTTTALTSSSNPSTPKSTVTFTAVVSWTSVTGAPTGSVKFYDADTYLGMGTLGSGTAAFATSSLAAGTHSITAEYVSDGNFVGSTSKAISQVVNASAATLAVNASPSPASPSDAITFTGTVTGSLGTATGSIALTEGTTPIGTITLSNGTGSFAASTFPVGTHTFTAVYSGDSVYGSTTGSVVLVVASQTTTTTLTSSANPSTVGETVTFAVTVSSTLAGVTGSVQLFDGQVSLGTMTLTNGSASFSVKTLTAGTHTIQAQYAGNTTYAESASVALMQVVKTATTSTDGGTSTDGSTGDDAGPTKKAGGGGCDVANGSASGALVALMLLAIVFGLRRRTA